MYKKNKIPLEELREIQFEGWLDFIKGSAKLVRTCHPYQKGLSLLCKTLIMLF